MDYYNEIKNELLDNELTKKAKDYSKNRSDLAHYYNVGKLLIEAQGGEENTTYGNNLIKEYSKRLTRELGKGYSWRNLYNMRTYYLFCSNNTILQPLAAKLNWNHYTIILSLKDISHDKTMGIICKHDDKLILEYCSDSRIFSTTYEITC